MSDQHQTRTFRGRSLAELTDRIKAELGDDAVAVSVRQGRTKGLGGFFAQETVEVEAVAGPNGHPVTPAPATHRELEPTPARSAEPSFYERLREAGGVDALQKAFVAANDADSYDMLMPDGQELPAINDLDDDPDPEPAAPAVIPYETRFEVAARPAEALAPVLSAPEPAPAMAAIEAAPVAVAPAPGPAMPAEAPSLPAIAMAPPTFAPVPAEAAPSTEVDAFDDDGDDLLPAIFVTPARDLPAVPESAAVAREALIERGFEEDLVDEILAEVIDHLMPFAPRNASMRKLIANQVSRQMTPLPRRSGERTIVGFIGSGGAGKTRCAAQLALAYARRGSQALCVISLRPDDGGAGLRQQLLGCDIEVHVARNGRMARAIVEAAGDASLIVVDTPQVNPRAVAGLRRLQSDLAHLQLDECHLALPATISYRHAAELVRAARTMGVDAIVITHADETQYLGTAVSVAIRSELPVSYVGRVSGQQRGLRPALTESLALALVS